MLPFYSAFKIRVRRLIFECSNGPANVIWILSERWKGDKMIKALSKETWCDPVKNSTKTGSSITRYNDEYKPHSATGVRQSILGHPLVRRNSFDGRRCQLGLICWISCYYWLRKMKAREEWETIPQYTSIPFFCSTSSNNPYHTTGKFSRRKIDIFSYFSQKIGFDISCKLSPEETICMKWQSQFSGKNEKKFQNVVCCNFTQHAKC